MPDAIAGLNPMQGSGLHGSVDQTMNAMAGMDSEGFLNLLVAQLQYQSPLEPSDPGDLMTQTAALAQLDANQQLLQIQQRRFGLDQAVAASNLLGTEVSATTTDGEQVAGVVDAVRYTPMGPVLSVGGAEVAYSQVTELRNTTSAGTEAEPDPGDDGTAPAPEQWDGPVTTAAPIVG